MPLKTHKRQQKQKKHSKHYAQVYWPYMPLLVIVGLSLLVGQSFVARSQRGVLSYATNISRQSLLEKTNSKRDNAGADDLTINRKLNQAAQNKAMDMASQDYWSHNSPDGKAPWAFVEDRDYDYQKAGENLAYGFLTSDETVNGWMNSPSHRQNLLDAAYTQVGFGIANSTDYLGKGPETVVVAIYARPASAPKLTVGNEITNQTGSPTTSQQSLGQQEVQSVSKIQAVTGGTIPGLTFVLGLLAGAGIAYLAIKHSIALKRTLRNGEKFILKHPLLDVTIVSFVALVVLLSQSVGYIL